MFWLISPGSPCTPGARFTSHLVTLVFALFVTLAVPSCLVLSDALNSQSCPPPPTGHMLSQACGLPNSPDCPLLALLSHLCFRFSSLTSGGAGHGLSYRFSLPCSLILHMISPTCTCSSTRYHCLDSASTNSVIKHPQETRVPAPSLSLASSKSPGQRPLLAGGHDSPEEGP